MHGARIGSGTYDPMFITTDRAGIPVRTVTVKPPAGVYIVRLACTSLHSCVVAGTKVSTVPNSFEVGTWNGKRLSLHPVAIPDQTSRPAVEGISCVGAICEIVGYVAEPATNDGIAITTSHGVPVAIHTIVNYPIHSVSCTTTSRCYAAGWNDVNPNEEGSIEPLTDGVPGAVTSVPGLLDGIACRGATCEAVGQEHTPSVIGALYTVTSGQVRATRLIPQSSGYFGVSAYSPGVFSAVGAFRPNPNANPNGTSLLTIG